MIKYTKTTTVYISDENAPLIDVVAKNRGYNKETNTDTAQEYISQTDNQKEFESTKSEIMYAIRNAFGDLDPEKDNKIKLFESLLDNGALQVESKFETLEDNK